MDEYLFTKEKCTIKEIAAFYWGGWIVTLYLKKLYMIYKYTFYLKIP